MINQEIIERIRAETDIVGLIGEYVKLKRTGKSFVGLCPFHQEKTPSFNVSPDRQVYHCFGCGESGNVISFVMNYENVTFPEAVKRLGERLGIKVSFTAEDDPTKPLVQALQIAQKIYVDYLWSDSGRDAQRYLAGRGLKKETVEGFGLGLVPHDTTQFLSTARQAKLGTNVLSEAGVLATRSGRLYPFLAGRIVFPIFSPSGRLVGFSGRVWGDDDNPAKYVNTPETRLFKKRRLLYGLSKARAYLRREGVILVEGQFDVLRLVQAGFNNTIAPLGTAFTAEHSRVLARYTDNVTLVFDGDEAGRKAAFRSLGEVLSADLDVRLLVLPDGEDPDSFLSAHQPDEFNALLAGAKEPMNFTYSLLKPSSVSQRKRAAEAMISVIRRVPNRLRRELYLDEAANLLKIDRVVLADLIKQPKRGAKPGGDAADVGETVKDESVKRLLRMMIQDPEYVVLASQHLKAESFPEGGARELLEKMYGMVEMKKTFSVGELLDSLSPEMQRQVSAWSFSEISYSRQEFAKALADYLYRRKRESLRNELTQAEHNGDSEKAQKILAELNNLLKERDKIYHQEL